MSKRSKLLNDDTSQSKSNISSVAIARINKGKETQSTKLSLPGGYVQPTVEQPVDIGYYFRSYLDVLFNSVLIESTHSQNSIASIPTVVRNILAYNNILFKTVEMRKTNCERVVEPIWFSYSVNESKLKLYVNQERYREYCSMRTDVPITWPSGNLHIERYNPYRVHKKVDGALDIAVQKCAIACDHVAQHIIHAIMSETHNRHNTTMVDRTTLHENWTKYGTTLHSMLALELVLNESSNSAGSQHRFMAMISTSSNTRNSDTVVNRIDNSSCII
uniref:GrBNV_gp13-like protein n=1 Tax=Nilaparvata lugens endogenous nudivirus TaxID=1487700 RepID=X5G6J7_9VIRU|nr:GrBNV_gp13-like protein [Nilaparvata lugens endogenous nudivirus]